MISLSWEDDTMFDVDIWLSEHEGACIDDYLKALVADEEKCKSEQKGIFIDDHLLSYLSVLEDVYYRKHNKPVDYMGLLDGHGLTQEDVYVILLEIITSGESFFSGYIKQRKKNSLL